MSIDPYGLCPCGSGKKIRFCCCKDLTAELERLDRMLKGEQYAACLEFLDGLTKKHPDRPALLALQTSLLMSREQSERAEAVVARLLEVAPQNPVGLALRAVSLLDQDDVRGAIDQFQLALEQTPEYLPEQVLSSAWILANALLVRGMLPSGLAHLMVVAGMQTEREKEAVELLQQVYSAPQVPLLLKQPIFLRPAPEGAAWAAGCEEGMQLASRACWRAALAKFTTLAEAHPDEPTLHWNLAALHGYLAETPESVTQLRRFAKLSEQTALDDAVEAETLAQLLDLQFVEPADEISFAEIEWTCEVTSVDPLMERLLSAKNLVSMPSDPEAAGLPDGPPKAVFWLLDRPDVPAEEDLSLDAVPRVLADLFVYGRTTDRAPRLMAHFVADEQGDRIRQEVRSLVGEQLQGEPSEESNHRVLKDEHVLSWRWRLPPGMPRARRAELLDANRRQVFAEAWPQTPLAALGGKSLREVAGDPQMRLAALGAILQLELSTMQQWSIFDFNTLRSELGLPTLEAVDPTGIDMRRLPLARLLRVDEKKIPDESLVQAFNLAASRRVGAAAEKLGQEILGRESLADKIDKNAIFQVLATSAGSSDQALGYIQQAKQYAASQGQSPANWLINELVVRLSSGEVEQAIGVVQQLQTRHIREPGVGQALASILSQFGLMPAGGMPPGGGMPAAAGMPDLASPAAAEPGKLWTPGSDQPASSPKSEGGAEKKLWMPGMD